MLNMAEGIATAGVSASIASVVIVAIKQKLSPTANGKYVRKEEYVECVKRLEQGIKNVDGKVDDIREGVSNLIALHMGQTYDTDKRTGKVT